MSLISTIFGTKATNYATDIANYWALLLKGDTCTTQEQTDLAAIVDRLGKTQDQMTADANRLVELSTHAVNSASHAADQAAYVTARNAHTTAEANLRLDQLLVESTAATMANAGNKSGASQDAFNQISGNDPSAIAVRAKYGL